MSRKLATTIKDSAIPGKWKRIAEAYAAFANNDGTNIYPTKGKLGAKAGCSPDTVYRQTPDLLACGLLSVASSHVCRIENCNKGSHHYTGRQGKYTTAYNLHVENLQNAETYLSAKCLKVNAAKCRQVLAANCGTDSGIKETPAPPSLGIAQNSSALTGGIDQSTNQPASGAQDQKSKSNPVGVGEAKKEEKQNQPRIEPREMPFSGSVVEEAELLRHMGKCFNAFRNGAKPTDAELGLFMDVMAKCHENCCFPEQAMEYAQKHMPPKLVGGLRSVKGLWNAVCAENVSSTNGLIAQYKDHSVETCGLCKKELAAMPCSRCHGSTYGKPSIERGKPYCGDCMKLPKYRRESGNRSFLTAGDI